MQGFVILRVMTGSRAFGLAGPTSDEDRRGIFLPTASANWGLNKPPEQYESIVDGVDIIDWEIEKFISQAMKGNPTILETLWSPIVLETTPLGEELLAMRRAFLSRRLIGTYLGYSDNQFALMSRRSKEGLPIRYKHAMHLIRLLYSGLHAIQTGEILVDVGEHREELLAIRHGEVSWEAVSARREELTAQFREIEAQQPFPEEPDFDTINAYLIRARRYAAEKELSTTPSSAR
ncbi:MAG: nucleotidyltransferase domain-containing protein [Fimbriiglobus sp.]